MRYPALPANTPDVDEVVVRTAPTHSEPFSNVLYVEYAAFPDEDVDAQGEYYDLDDDEFQETNLYDTECSGTACEDLETLLGALKECGGGPTASDSCQALEEE